MHFVYIFIMLAIAQVSLNAQLGTLQCSVSQEVASKIICRLETQRKSFERDVVFLWHSEEYPQDDRERSITLRANHGSVYDFRFLHGRAQGLWTVSATIDDDLETEVSYSFTLQDNNFTVRSH